MATYHVTVAPRPWEEPDPKTRPLSPRDVTADSEQDALAQADAFIAEARHPIWQRAYEDAGGDADAANRATDFIDQWQPIARRVERPTVEVQPRALVSVTMRDGVVIGERYEYETPDGEQSFDVLIDGVVRGRLVGRAGNSLAWVFRSAKIISSDRARRNDSRGRMWFLAEANGPLVLVADRRWDEPSSGVVPEWPDAVLADIRAALETASGRNDG